MKPIMARVRALVPEYPVWSPPPRPPRDNGAWVTLPERMPPPSAEVVYSRTGLLLALEAFGLAPGDEVLLPAYLCASMVTPVVAGGFSPARFEVGEDLEASAAEVEGRIGPRTRAVVAVHYFGFVQELAPLRAMCERRGLRLVEDCTHAFYRRGEKGARGQGETGHAVLASPYKFCPASEGGLLWLRGEGLEAPSRLRAPRFREALRDAYGVLERSYLAGRAGWLSPLVGAAVRLRNLRRPPDRGEGAAPPPGDSEESLWRMYEPHRRRAAAWSRRLAARVARYDDAPGRRRRYADLAERLAGLDGLRLRPLDGDTVPFCLPLFGPRAARAEAALLRAGVRLQRFGRAAWPAFGGGFPRAEEISAQGIQLPIHGSVGERHLEAMARAIREA